ncbi:large ribosomal subunit protein bL35m [Rhynchocyon petersi]
MAGRISENVRSPRTWFPFLTAAPHACFLSEPEGLRQMGKQTAKAQPRFSFGAQDPASRPLTSEVCIPRASDCADGRPGWWLEALQRGLVATLLPNVLKPPVRALTYYSARKGKRKTVKAVVYRFLRLHSGLWLRRKAGYKKKLWKKTSARKKRLREFVFCNKTQSKLLDKMTTSFWKRRNWYANDPYQLYHDRTNLKV